MSRKLIFATHNHNKVREINSIMPIGLSVVSLKDIMWTEEIEEPYLTLEENAKEKAKVLYEALGKECFSEDSGLFIDALNGEPGVFSARYAAKNNVEKDNIDHVLNQMEKIPERDAHFRTVICFAENNNYHYFTGICDGNIVEKKTGVNGFGSDPIFKPSGAGKTFAEMTMNEKNQFSHRKKATDLFINFLEKKYGEN